MTTSEWSTFVVASCCSLENFGSAAFASLIWWPSITTGCQRFHSSLTATKQGNMNCELSNNTIIECFIWWTPRFVLNFIGGEVIHVCTLIHSMTGTWLRDHTTKQVIWNKMMSQGKFTLLVRHKCTHMVTVLVFWLDQSRNSKMSVKAFVACALSVANIWSCYRMSFKHFGNLTHT